MRTPRTAGPLTLHDRHVARDIRERGEFFWQGIMAEGLLSRLGGRGQSSGNAASKNASQEEFEVKHSDEEWRKLLAPEQYRVLRQHGTERAGTSPLDKTYDPGIYYCAGCGQPLFDASTKFNSGTGWPSFYEPLENAVE